MTDRHDVSAGRSDSIARWWGKTGEDLRVANALALRELKQRYARSVLGPIWMIATPALTLGLYWIVFGQGFGVEWTRPEGGSVGYIAPFFAGLVLYLFVSDLVPSSLNLFVAQRALVQRSTLSLNVIWLSNLIRAGYHFAVSLVLLLIVCAAGGHLQLIGCLLGLLTAIIALAVGSALSLFLASLGPFFGDAANVTQFALRALFYAAPVTYPLTLVPESLRGLIWLNPLTPLVVAMRDGLIFQSHEHLPLLLLLAAAAVILNIAGAWLLRAAGRAIPDVV